MKTWTIVKDSGSIPWHVYKGGEFVRRFETKLDASIWVEIELARRAGYRGRNIRPFVDHCGGDHA